MSEIPNPIYRKIHALAFESKRKSKALEEMFGLTYDLLTAARNAAVDLRNASLILAAKAEKENSLSGYRLAEKLVAHAQACEIAVKEAGGYEKPATEERG